MLSTHFKPHEDHYWRYDTDLMTPKTLGFFDTIMVIIPLRLKTVGLSEMKCSNQTDCQTDRVKTIVSPLLGTPNSVYEFKRDITLKIIIKQLILKRNWTKARNSEVQLKKSILRGNHSNIMRSLLTLIAFN